MEHFIIEQSHDFAVPGCRAGDTCPFLHDPSRLKKELTGSKGKDPHAHVKQDATSEQETGSRHPPSTATHVSQLELPEGRRFIAPPVESDRVVPKPISRAQADDPREFQIQQLKRRFSPEVTAEDGGTVLMFQMAPSDPDFPFEMTSLECLLHVPASYPQHERPWLQVRNREMGRGYQINVERGFAQMAASSPQATLLELMKRLDRHLEILLTEPKAETVKIVPNVAAGGSVQGPKKVPAQRNDAKTMATSPVPCSSRTVLPAYSIEQNRSAEARRSIETRQLETRLGRLPAFSKSSDGVVYTIPITPGKRGELPVPLQAVKSVKLTVPIHYPLESCRVELVGVTREAARNTEKGFERRVKANQETTLLGHVNYLAQQMHTLATVIEDDRDSAEIHLSIDRLDVNDSQPPSQSTTILFADETDRSHIKVIPRPPEWALNDDDEDESSDDSDEEGSIDEATDEIEGEEAIDSNTEARTTGPERGILISFPFLELHSIELLELVSLSITVKCERCKDTMDIKNLRDSAKIGSSGVRSESCKKCANPMSIGIMKPSSCLDFHLSSFSIRLQAGAHACQFGPCWLSRS